MSDVTPMMEGYHCCPGCGKQDMIEREDTNNVAVFRCRRCDNEVVGICDLNQMRLFADRARMMKKEEKP